jgi:hypothetical protein
MTTPGAGNRNCLCPVFFGDGFMLKLSQLSALVGLHGLYELEQRGSWKMLSRKTFKKLSRKSKRQNLT